MAMLFSARSYHSVATSIRVHLDFPNDVLRRLLADLRTRQKKLRGLHDLCQKMMKFSPNDLISTLHERYERRTRTDRLLTKSPNYNHVRCMKIAPCENDGPRSLMAIRPNDDTRAYQDTRIPRRWNDDPTLRLSSVWLLSRLTNKKEAVIDRIL